jgi:hypothetical protein
MPISRSVSTVGVAATAAVALTAGLFAHGAGAATLTAKLTYGGHAYGSQLHVGTLVKSDRTAYVPQCTTAVGASHSDTTAAVNAANVGTVGAVKTNVRTKKISGGTAQVSTSKTATTALLGGLIKFDAVTAVATESLVGSQHHAAGKVTFVDLTIAGKRVPSAPKANTRLTIPGVATVTLNAQDTTSRATSHAIAVAALRVDITGSNVLHLPAGRIVIGAAWSALLSKHYRPAYGSAYGTSANAAKLVGSGPTARAYLPCGGSNGKTRTNSTAEAKVSSLVSASGVSSSAKSVDTARSTTATTANHLASVTVLGGAVKIGAISVSATATRTKSGLKAATSASVAAIKVDDRKITLPPAGKSISIPNLGILTYDRTVKSGSSITVYALQLTLGSGVASAPAGTVINIGVASAGVRSAG